VDAEVIEVPAAPRAQPAVLDLAAEPVPDDYGK
jgi:hypothetical protein